VSVTDHKMQNFSCWGQFFYLAFTQLTGPKSLRDIEACLGSQKRKPHYTGFIVDYCRCFATNYLDKCAQLRVVL
jgi:hypothetical protein